MHLHVGGRVRRRFSVRHVRPFVCSNVIRDLFVFSCCGSLSISFLGVTVVFSLTAQVARVRREKSKVAVSEKRHFQGNLQNETVTENKNAAV